jgi:YXWGXW repeat-containing protein
MQENRKMRHFGKALIIGLSIAGGAVMAPVIASAAVAVDITVAPPVPRVEVVPPPRPGFVWAPGFWEWRGGAHVWVPGRWMGERPGWHWAPDRWEQRGDHWHHWRGHWER